MTGFWGVLVGVEVSVSSTVGVRKVFSGVGVAVAGPLVGVAVNMTAVPAQTGLTEAAMETLTGRLVLTAIVMVFEVAGDPVAQDSLEVSRHVTTSLLAGV